MGTAVDRVRGASRIGEVKRAHPSMARVGAGLDGGVLERVRLSGVAVHGYQFTCDFRLSAASSRRLAAPASRADATTSSPSLR